MRTATNPQTGEKFAFIAGKWVPVPGTTPPAPPPEPEGPGIVDRFVTGPLQRGAGQAIESGAVGLGSLGAISPETAADYALRGRKMAEAAPRTPEDEAGLREIGNAETLGQAGKAILRNPGATASVAVESLPQSAGSLILSAIGAIGGGITGGPIGAALGMAAGAGAGSYATEYAASLAEVVRNAGGDPDDPEDLKLALGDQNIMAQAKERALRRAVPVAAFDALSGGLAGRLVSGAKGVTSFAGRSAGELGIQSGAGAAGEALAQQRVGEYRPGDIGLEAAAEIPGGVVETAIGAATKGRGAEKPTAAQETAPARAPADAELLAIGQLPDAEARAAIREKFGVNGIKANAVLKEIRAEAEAEAAPAEPVKPASAEPAQKVDPNPASSDPTGRSQSQAIAEKAKANALAMLEGAWTPIRESEDPDAPIVGYINEQTGQQRTVEEHRAGIETPLSGLEPQLPAPAEMAAQVAQARQKADGATVVTPSLPKQAQPSGSFYPPPSAERTQRLDDRATQAAKFGNVAQPVTQPPRNAPTFADLQRGPQVAQARAAVVEDGEQQEQGADAELRAASGEGDNQRRPGPAAETVDAAAQPEGEAPGGPAGAQPQGVGDGGPRPEDAGSRSAAAATGAADQAAPEQGDAATAGAVAGPGAGDVSPGPQEPSLGLQPQPLTFTPNAIDTEDGRPVQVAVNSGVRTVTYEDGGFRQERVNRTPERYRPLGARGVLENAESQAGQLPASADRVLGLGGDEKALPLPEARALQELRSQGDSRLPEMEGRLPGVPAGYGAEAEPGALNRPDRRDEGLRAGQLPVGDGSGANAEPLDRGSAADVPGRNVDDVRVGASAGPPGRSTTEQAEQRLVSGASADDKGRRSKVQRELADDQRRSSDPGRLGADDRNQPDNVRAETAKRLAAGESDRPAGAVDEREQPGEAVQLPGQVSDDSAMGAGDRGQGGYNRPSTTEGLGDRAGSGAGVAGSATLASTPDKDWRPASATDARNAVLRQIEEAKKLPMNDAKAMKAWRDKSAEARESRAITYERLSTVRARKQGIDSGTTYRAGWNAALRGEPTVKYVREQKVADEGLADGKAWLAANPKPREPGTARIRAFNETGARTTFEVNLDPDALAKFARNWEQLPSKSLGTYKRQVKAAADKKRVLVAEPEIQSAAETLAANADTMTADEAVERAVEDAALSLESELAAAAGDEAYNPVAADPDGTGEADAGGQAAQAGDVAEGDRRGAADEGAAVGDKPGAAGGEVDDGPVASVDDIPLERAVNAYRWNSMTPEKRAREDREGYVAHVEELYQKLLPKAETPEQKALLRREVKQYAKDYVARFLPTLDAKSRTASAMVTGPARFPTARNRKAIDTESRRLEEFFDWQKKAQRRLQQAIAGAQNEDQRAAERLERAKNAVLREIGVIASIDADTGPFRGFNRATFVNGLAKIIRTNEEFAPQLLDLVKRADAIKADKPIFTARHPIWKLDKAAEESVSAAPEDELPARVANAKFQAATGPTPTVVETTRLAANVIAGNLPDAEAARLRAKIDAELRPLLKRLAGDRADLKVFDAIRGVNKNGDRLSVGGAQVRDLIAIAVLDGERVRTSDERAGTLRHEVLHLLRETNAIPAPAWAALEAKAPGWRKALGIDAEPAYAALSEPARNEEAIAEAYARWARGELKLAGSPQAGFRAIRRFLDALRGIVAKALGLPKLPRPADVFAAIERGDYSSRSGPEAAALESAADRGARHAELLRDLSGTPAFRKQGLYGLDRPTQRAVLSRVFALAHQPKVLDAVIKLLPVQVVNDLGGGKLTAKGIFNNEAMFQNALSVDADTPVAGRNAARATLSVIARAAAKELGVPDDLGGLSLDGGAALRADPNLRGAIRRLTGAAAEKAGALGDAGRRSVDGNPAVGTGADRHDSIIATLVADDNSLRGLTEINGVLVAGRKVNKLGGAMQVRAYHGSPHTFDRFDLSKIGTGEGAQAYGHGLYFAERQGVAQSYQSKLSANNSEYYYKGKQGADFASVLGEMMEDLKETGITASEREEIEDELFPLMERSRSIPRIMSQMRQSFYEPTPAVARALEEIERNLATEKGSLYTVNLDVEPEDLLDWDKPLSQQSEKVRKALEEAIENAANDSPRFAAERVQMAALESDDTPTSDWIKSLEHFFDPRDVSARLRATGIPGIRYLDGGSRSSGEGTSNYVIFDDSLVQITARLQTTTLGRGAMLRDAITPEAMEATVAETDGFVSRLLSDDNRASIERRTDEWRRLWQDRQLPWLRLQQAVEKLSGRPLPAWANAYRAEEASYSAKGERTFRLMKDRVEPILKIAKDSGLKHKEISDYLKARGAKDRNEYVASINPKFPDGGSGIMTADAQRTLDGFTGEKRAALDRIADLFQQMNRDRTDLLVESGRYTADDIANWERAYPFYVPYRGVEGDPDPEMAAAAAGARTGRGFLAGRAGEKRVTGRSTEAWDPLSMAIAMAKASIDQAEKNTIRQAVFNLAQQVNDPEVLEVQPRKRQAYMANFTDPRSGNKVKAVRYRYVEDYDPTNTLSAWIGGREFLVKIKDKTLAEAAGRMSGTELPGLFEKVAAVTQFLSKSHTMLSPEFLVTNFARDIQTALINIGAEKAKGIRGKVLKSVPAAVKGAWRYLETGKADTKWAQHARDFRADGGATAFNPITDAIQEAKDIQIALGELQGGTLGKMRGALRRIGSKIENANSAIDYGIRLGTYVALREAGISRSEAASAAKNLTVNFNRRGEYGSALNALYMFANAGIQGTATLATALYRSKQVRALVGGVVAAGFMQEMLASLLLPPPEGDDDEDKLGLSMYDKIPEYIKTTNMIVPYGSKPGDYLKIPMPYGYNFFHNLGRLSAAYMRGAPEENGKPMSEAKLAARLVGSLGQAFLPIGVIPTLATPFYEVATNENWMGNKIMPDRFPGDKTPDAYRSFESVSVVSPPVAQALNSITGGTAYKPGEIDVSPESIDHVISFFLGGAVNKVWEMGNDLVKGGKELAGANPESPQFGVGNLPFVRKVVGSNSPWLAKDITYRRLEEVESLNDELKGLQTAVEEARTPDARAELSRFRSENRAMLALKDEASRTRRTLSKMRKERLAILGSDAPTAEQRARTDALREREQEILTAFNRRYIRALQ